MSASLLMTCVWRGLIAVTLVAGDDLRLYWSHSLCPWERWLLRFKCLVMTGHCSTVCPSRRDAAATCCDNTMPTNCLNLPPLPSGGVVRRHGASVTRRKLQTPGIAASVMLGPSIRSCLDTPPQNSLCPRASAAAFTAMAPVLLVLMWGMLLQWSCTPAHAGTQIPAGRRPLQ